MNKFNDTMFVIRDALQYSIFEALFLVLVIADGWGGDPLHPFTVYSIAAIATIWVVASNTREALAEAQEMVLHRELYQSDFLMSALILILIALMFYTKGVEPYVVAVVIVAAGQNLRYTWLVNRWITEAIDDDPRKDDGSSDKDV